MSETQTQETEKAPAPGTPEHDAAMAARFEQAQKPAADAGKETPTEKPTRPDHIPEKFWDAEKGEVRVEAMAKSYAELEKGKTKPETEKPTTEKPQVEVPADETAEQKAAREAAAGAGVNFDEAQAEYSTDGKLSDATYEKLAKAGIDRNTVDSYIAGQEALASQARTTIFTAIGGEDNWNAMAAWATSNVPKAELVSLNETLAGRDLGKAKLAVEGLYAQYTKANGSDPTLVTGDGKGKAGDTYQSTRQYLDDIGSKQYAKDPAFRALCDAKLARSNIM